MSSNRIRMLRREAGYSQKELGDALKVGQTTISAWEVGRNEPDSASCFKMTKLFGCSIGYLLGYEKESKYRGLSEQEWKYSEMEEWEKSGKPMFPETFEIDQLLERTNKKGRKRAVEVIKLMFPLDDE